MFAKLSKPLNADPWPIGLPCHAQFCAEWQSLTCQEFSEDHNRTKQNYLSPNIVQSCEISKEEQNYYEINFF